MPGRRPSTQTLNLPHPEDSDPLTLGVVHENKHALELIKMFGHSGTAVPVTGSESQLGARTVQAVDLILFAVRRRIRRQCDLFSNRETGFGHFGLLLDRRDSVENRQPSTRQIVLLDRTFLVFSNSDASSRFVDR